MRKKTVCTWVCSAVLACSIVPAPALCAAASEGQVKLTPGLEYRLEDEEAVITGGNRYLPEELVIPDTIRGLPVTRIEKDAFYHEETLTSVTLPESLTEIGQSAFMGCSHLISINLPSDVTTIGKEAFSQCTRLIEITLPDKLTEVSDRLFMNCYALEKVVLPEKVTSVGAYAFSGCSRLMELELP